MKIYDEFGAFTHRDMVKKLGYSDTKIRYRMKKLGIDCKHVYDYWEFERICFQINNYYSAKENKLKNDIIETIEPKYFKNLKYNLRLRLLLSNIDIKKKMQRYIKKNIKLIYKLEEFENLVCRIKNV
jgi:hypothetical protein